MGGVSSSASETAAVPGLWFAPILRAVPAVGAGLAITFTADHSPTVGIAMLAVFGLGTAVVLLATGMRLVRTEPLRGLHIALGIIAVAAGVLATAALLSGAAGLPMFLLLVGGYAVLAGALEFVWGLRHRGRDGFARDALAIGTGTLALALVLAFVGDPVSAVGFFGAYAVIIGVYLIIAGFSLKWSAPVTESSLT